MKKILLFSMIFFTMEIASTRAQSTPVPLWPNGAPNAVGKEPLDVPTITPFLVAGDRPVAAVIVCPGGGYSHLSDIKEGSDVAKWLNSIGISVFVLKYRLGMRYHQPNQLLDAARALRTVRADAKQWNIDPRRIGILGFSAGGHLASTLGTHFDEGKPDSEDEIERVSSRPDLMILVYPVITMGDLTHKGSRTNLLGDDGTPELIKLYSNELHVTAETPPTFLVHAVTDPAVPVENSLVFADALRKAKVPFEIHLYERGPHGFGLAPTNPTLATWTELCANWLAVRGFIKAKTATIAK
jgi:acetyl esterase/lipase